MRGVLNHFFILCISICLIVIAYTHTAPLSAAEYIPLVSGFPQVTPNANDSSDFASYVNFLIRTIIGITGIIAVVMIVYGGIQYVSTDAWSEKSDGKKRIQAAVGGLVLALSSYLILNTIDPSLTYLNFADSLKPVTTVVGGGLQVIEGGDYDYDNDESIALDPTGSTGSVLSGDLETNVDLDSCAGLGEYRAAGSFEASDKGGTSGAIKGEIAWLMKAVPLKWPGLQVMSSYRSLRWNLISAYKQTPAKADEIIAAFEKTNKTYQDRIAITSQYGIKRAALTSNHVLGEAVDFAGSGLSTGQGDQLAAWARSNSCLRIPEVLWRTTGHYDHVHLGI